METVIGQIISIIANICVIAGIIFLAVELHQNNRLLRAQARYSLRQYRADIADTIMSPHVLAATHKYASGEPVTPIERSAAFMTALKGIELWEWQYGEYAAGMLERERLPIGAWKRWFNGHGPSPVPFREAWEMQREVMDAKFVQFFEEQVLGHDASESGTQ